MGSIFDEMMDESLEDNIKDNVESSDAGDKDTTEYMVIGVSKTSKHVYYLGYGALDKAIRIKEVIEKSLLGDKAKVVSLRADDNAVQLKEDSQKLYKRFKYLIDEFDAIEDSGYDSKEVEDDLLSD